VVLDNMEKGVDAAVGLAIEGIAKGTQDHIVAYGLKEGGVGLTSLHDDVANSKCEIVKFPDAIAKAKDLRAKIESGEIKLADPMLNPRK